MSRSGVGRGGNDVLNNATRLWGKVEKRIMAGAICIAKGSAWSVGSVAFDVIVRLTRQELMRSKEEGLIEEIYAPLEQGFDIIALDDLDGPQFCRFFAHSRTAFLAYRSGQTCAELPYKCDEGVMKCWLELLETLERDSRFDRDCSWPTA